MKKTSPKSIPQTYQIAILGARSFPAKIWPYVVSEKDWTDDEADSFMRLLDCSKDVLPSVDPDGLSLKMLNVCIAHAMDSTLPSFYLSWPLSGMTLNGHKGDSYDNAVAENFFSCLKCECICLQYFAAKNAAKSAVFHYIEAFCNKVQPHSGIGWLAPNTYEALLNDGDIHNQRYIA